MKRTYGTANQFTKMGREAYKAGLPRTANPYDEATARDPWTRWNKGWDNFKSYQDDIVARKSEVICMNCASWIVRAGGVGLCDSKKRIDFGDEIFPVHRSAGFKLPKTVREAWCGAWERKSDGPSK